jgi:cytochrome P450
MAFGGGGRALPRPARGQVEIIAMLRELLTRLPDLEPAGAPERLASNFIAGPRTMPVRYTPR